MQMWTYLQDFSVAWFFILIFLVGSIGGFTVGECLGSPSHE